jgi:hypothetical protein
MFSFIRHSRLLARLKVRLGIVCPVCGERPSEVVDTIGVPSDNFYIGVCYACHEEYHTPIDEGRSLTDYDLYVQDELNSM